MRKHLKYSSCQSLTHSHAFIPPKDTIQYQIYQKYTFSSNLLPWDKISLSDLIPNRCFNDYRCILILLTDRCSVGQEDNSCEHTEIDIRSRGNILGWLQIRGNITVGFRTDGTYRLALEQGRIQSCSSLYSISSMHTIVKYKVTNVNF